MTLNLRAGSVRRFAEVCWPTTVKVGFFLASRMAWSRAAATSNHLLQHREAQVDVGVAVDRAGSDEARSRKPDEAGCRRQKLGIDSDRELGIHSIFREVAVAVSGPELNGHQHLIRLAAREVLHLFACIEEHELVRCRFQCCAGEGALHERAARQQPEETWKVRLSLAGGVILESS
eukprot:CAMPEP_0181511490 /NCGR_PEP_ID=MMETSP1110-20121109/61459_1 /TAXON_ID=174948 /ORGANISM="Symbiodinium sp., Strain CCMP421" /LENGTH=175 /DNA_ID=CAMNT_0023641225 /DNA_START=22 /DNA_END=548 /DNA_ORIENTATION=-